MSETPARGDEPRDTIVPHDAAPDAAERDTIVPTEAPPPVFRRDPSRRVRRGLALGTGVALLVCATGVAPLVVVALVSAMADAPLTVAPVAAPVVDFAALRAAIADASAAPTPTSPAPAVVPDPSLHAFARLASRVYETREAWRKAGQSGRELFRTATLDELGANDLIDELTLGPRRFVWLRREARVLAPPSAQVPDGVAMKDAGNDPGPTSFEGTLDGRAVRAIRTCMFGESYCLVDVVDVAPAAAPPPALADGARLAAFDAVVTREAGKLASWVPPAAPGARPSSLLPLGAALAVALVLVGVTATRLRRIAAAVVGATARLRAANAGRAEPIRTEPDRAAELADLSNAIDETSSALGDGAARAEQASRRRERLGQLADALADAAGGRLESRAPLADDDDAALAALASGTNAALEQLDARVGSWQRAAAAALGAAPADALRALHADLASVSTSAAPAAAASRREPSAADANRRLPEPP
ncbi:MAG: hypothetical protein IT383_03870 [Deltaproteobacteria bacterium]|nr:hypothetical protein [Deltaproteobacteria bacterium]